MIIFFHRETDQLKGNQARQSVEDSKRLLSDKNFRNKQERDRRIRELNSNNMKKFIEERRLLSIRHDQETKNLDNLVKEEETALLEENNKVNEAFFFNLLFIHLLIIFILLNV